MINVILFLRDGKMSGFEISGHSTENADDVCGKLVCSAVSSAAVLVANTVTDVLFDKSIPAVSDGYLKLIADDAEKCAAVLDGFRLHICSLRDEYPDRIQVKMIAE